MGIDPMKVLCGILPESLLLVYVGLGLINIKLSIRNYIKITILYTIGLLVVRYILNFAGIHILILCLFLSLLFKIIAKVDWNLAIISSLLSLILLLLGEVLVYSKLLTYFGISIKEFLNSNNLILFNLIIFVTKVPLLICAFLIYFFEVNLLNSVGDSNAQVQEF
ncbi:hypothetical protein [Selenihalanaerobacter shriftii]|uniref:Uncharacterized protein n=1 Tax=Selenihalanaerobacter shriftii TaxID=142842 RepID=A0A1T4Q8Q8_9FIRM|nr:hypothetical protein [Selenihalanaerobacter shriftii]SKA00016.1 hypothetical protein SAMN02745118_02473 [Selenihalanaerobacter shriftii]